MCLFPFYFHVPLNSLRLVQCKEVVFQFFFAAWNLPSCLMDILLLLIAASEVAPTEFVRVYVNCNVSISFWNVFEEFFPNC